MEKEVFESSLETARKRANIRRVEDLKKKKKCLPAGYPQAGFPEANMRINYEPCSNSRTEGCKGGEGKIGHPYYSRTITTLSLSVSPRLSFFLLFLFSPRRASSPPPLSRSFFFFYFSFEALFNFCRGIFPLHSDYYSQEMEEENRSRELRVVQGGSYGHYKGRETIRGNRLEIPR